MPEPIVSQGNVSTPEPPVSGTNPAAVTPPATPPPAPQPLSEAQISEIIAKEVEKASRKIQSDKDKATSEMRKLSLQARASEDALRSLISSLPPEYADRAELAVLKSRDMAYKVQETERVQEDTNKAFKETFYSNLKAAISAMGVDPESKEIDWAEDAPTAFDTQKRVLASAANILKKQQGGLEAKIMAKVQEEAKKTENSIRRAAGLDSVDTTTPAGVVDDSEKAFVNKVASGVPLTAEERKRAKSLLG